MTMLNATLDATLDLEQHTTEQLEANYERGLWVPAISGSGYRCVRKLADGVLEEGMMFRNTFKHDEAFNKCLVACEVLNVPAMPRATPATVSVTTAPATPLAPFAYTFSLTKDELCDLLRGEMGRYMPEPTREEWDNWCNSMSEAYANGEVN